MPQIALDRVTRTGKNCSRARKGPRTSAHHCFFFLILMVILTGIICNAFHFRAKEIIGYKRETI